MVTIGGRRVYAHRLVVERVLGHRLRPGQHVHHVDGDRTNNCPDNLRVLSAGEHSRQTRQIYPTVLACANCGERFRNRPGRPPGSSRCCCRRCARLRDWRLRRAGSRAVPDRAAAG